MIDPARPQDLLADLQQELHRCSKCGACQSVCPIYAQTGQEWDVARGKIALVEAVVEGSLSSSANYSHILHNCLLCLACTEQCSSSVHTEQIILGARAALLQEKGLAWPRRQIHALLKKGPLSWRALCSAGHLLQLLLFRKIPESSGLRRRFSLPGVQKDQLLPRLARKPFRDKFRSLQRSQPSAPDVVFFTGCAANYIFVDIAQTTVNVLNSLGLQVSVPDKQACCGAPVLAAGDLQTQISLAAANLKALSTDLPPETPVLCCCPSGGYMLKKIYPQLLTYDPELAQAAEDLSSRTYDIVEYLVQIIGLSRLKTQITRHNLARSTYHDPCHLKRGQGLSREPRQILKLCFPDSFAEMQQADYCCGLGGTYGVTHQEMSRRIRAVKLQRIQDTEAEQVITGCPACIIQLKDGLQSTNPGMKVRHTIQALAAAMGIPESSTG